MNTLLINTSYGPGGASQVVHNLHAEFLKQGIDSNVAVAYNEMPGSPNVNLIATRRTVPERIINKISSRFGLNNNGIISTFHLEREPWFKKADVLNLHNLHGNYFNFLALPRLTRSKPAVLTLHDMWSFTGHCVYGFDCDRWKSGCGQCPSTETYPAVRCNATWLEYRLKRWAFSRSRLHVVAVSRWMESLAHQSILGQLPIHYIPNGIDVQLYRPQPKNDARHALGLPQEGKIILYVAHNLRDPRKGFDLLQEALHRLPEHVRRDTTLLIMGDAGSEAWPDLPLKNHFLGFVSNDARKASAYSAADVLVFPTRADNLPVVLQESMACGLPMVSFNVGGVSELVRHGTTGYISKPEDIASLSQCITHLLDEKNTREQMSLRCREIALQEYNLELQIKRYIELFNAIM